MVGDGFQRFFALSLTRPLEASSEFYFIFAPELSDVVEDKNFE